ncbi:hypothetical protein QQF64_025652 [Cirrhinus molitorella]|uniref:Uncharacterized protein n=1 Tax=Cirrhinus molitorella TaxID=172907 RepID=A0ABR3NPY7_9TELE
MDETAESSAGFRNITKEIIKTNSNNRKHYLVNLRPAPLFCMVGLTGLSASLLPHRSLRSVLNTSGAGHVPLLLLENSPPPSPCSPSDILFFPLSVPHIQPFPRERRGDAPAQPD